MEKLNNPEVDLLANLLQRAVEHDQVMLSRTVGEGEETATTIEDAEISTCNSPDNFSDNEVHITVSTATISYLHEAQPYQPKS